GVICSDCHEPHSLKLRAPGNQVCTQCHVADRFETETHHFHVKGKAGSHCVDCHMPVKIYMQIDTRRDHQFSIPRPDLSEQLDTPNACSGCHANQTVEWAADKMREWYGRNPKGFQNFAETLHAIRSGAVDAFDRFMKLQIDQHQPIIARATALEEVNLGLNPGLLNVLVDALYDSDPMLRSAGLNALTQLPPQQRWLLAHDLLQDPVRSIRALAVANLAEVPDENMDANQRSIFERAANDYLSSLQMNADDPGAQVSLGNFYLARGETAKAEQAYREALYLDVNSVPAYVNYADLLHKMDRDAEGETLLHEGLTHQPKASALHHSLGLLQVRNKDLPNALVSFKKATELEPDAAQYSYIYAVALYSAGQPEAARSAVNSALMRTPNDPALNTLKAQLAAAE
ncbi:MAG: tetratricopeptide repeat protein, partial [Nitrosomonas sp.]